MNNKILYKEIDDLLSSSYDFFNLKSTDYYLIHDILEYSKITDYKLLYSLTVVLICLCDSLNKGSLCLKLQKDFFDFKTKCITNEPGKLLDFFLVNIKSYTEIITLDEEYKPIVLKEYNGIPYLYFQKYYENEKRLKAYLDSHINNDFDFLIEPAIVNEIKESDLNRKQKIAVYFSLLKNFVIISGGPGTGKTHIIYWIVKLLIKTGYNPKRIKIAAPTGRAAKRISESIKAKSVSEGMKDNDENVNCIEAETIHRLLKYSINDNDFLYNENNTIPADVIIIDEVSMVDVVLMNSLFQAIKKNTKIIFLGDKNQIPSVEAGAVLAELIPEDFKEIFSNKIFVITDELIKSDCDNKMLDRVIILDKCYRASGEIFKISDSINVQDKNVISDLHRVNGIPRWKDLNFENGCCYYIESDNIDLIKYKKILISWNEYLYFYKYGDYVKLVEKISSLLINKSNIDELKDLIDSIFNIIENVKVLCIIKNGIFGVNNINNYIADYFKNKIGIYNKKYFSGLPIIIMQNDYTKRLYNGDCGVLLKDASGVFKAVFKNGSSYDVFPVEFLPLFEFAFSITIHKSQGSEYNDVFIILPDDENNPLLTKEILYTGLTRTKNSAVIFSKNNVLKNTVFTKIDRRSGVSFY